MIYLQLFLSFLKIGAFSFGGGYAAMPMIQQQVVDAYHWLSVSEFGDLVTISQMTPGPIAINAATFVGIRVVGWQGALCATMGCVFPACVIVTVIAYFYVKYRHMEGLQMVLNTLRPAVIALILTSGITILTQAFFQESHIDICSRFGDSEKLYAIPFDSTTMILFYRKDIFEKYQSRMQSALGYLPQPGTSEFTWERYLEVAEWINNNVPEEEHSYL